MIRSLLLALALLAFAGADAAQPVSYRASYGPLSVCIAGYVASIPSDEAVTARFDEAGTIIGLSLWSDRFERLDVNFEASDPYDRRAARSNLTLTGLGDVVLYDYPTQGYYRAGIPGEVVWNEQAQHREYVLPERLGEPPLRVTSPRFEGPNDDRALLSRFRPREAATSCQPIPPDPDDQQTIEATSWSPVRTEGPAYLCLGELGVELRDSEFAQHRWPYGGYGPLGLRIRGPGYGIILGGGRDSTGPPDRPFGGLLEIGYRVQRDEGGSIILIPPPSYPQWAGPADLLYLTVWGLDEPALQAFLGRLEYVRLGTRPCAPLVGAVAAPERR